MLMRNVLPHIVLMAALMMAAASCEKHPAGTENLTASVRLSVGTGGNLDAGSDSWTKAAEGYVDPTAYEGLRTIRVIVTSGDADTRKVWHNDTKTIVESVSETDIPTETCDYTIEGLPVGIPLSFYVIANEESLGKTYSDFEGELDSNRKILYVDEETNIDNRHFPKRGPDIADLGLPMSGCKKEVTLDEGNNTVDVAVALDRSVVKMILTVENRSDEELKLETINLGPFFGDRFYMFREQQLDVPDTDNWSSKDYPVNEEVATLEAADLSTGTPVYDKTEDLTLYFYPTNAGVKNYNSGNNPYTIAITTSTRNYSALPFAPADHAFIRNTLVYIDAVITTSGVQLNFRVMPWETHNVDVPDFS